MNQTSLSAFIWSVADLLRGNFKQSDYGKVILPFTVLRRMDCVLAPTKAKVLAEYKKKTDAGVNPDPFLRRLVGEARFYNTSALDLPKLLGDQDHIRQNLYAYIQGFSPDARDIFERFDFHTQVERLAKDGLLYLVTEKFANIDLHPDRVDNAQMGHVFEELIRKFAELSNETAGEHFTPREVIRLMVNLIFIEDDDVLTPGNAVVRTLYDPTAGTGGMLSVAAEHLLAHNPAARLTLSGQELNDESYAICKADMLIRGQPVENMVAGNTLSDDGHAQRKFDYMLSNPPFGVEWKKVEKQVRAEHEQKGFDGRFGPGLPRVSDGSMLFLLHLVAKMAPVVNGEGGSRFGIVLNGSPLFTGGAGSGESEIRRYLLENDLVEAIIGLPTDMFYNTGISTYVWIVSNKKPAERRGKLQLIDASGFWQKMRKSLGSKRKQLKEDQIADIARLHDAFEPGAISKVFQTTDFGYRRITVERPLRMAFEVTPERLAVYAATKGAEHADLFAKVQGRFDNLTGFLLAAGVKKLSKGALKAVLASLGEKDPAAQPMLDDKKQPLPDADLREFENVPLSQDIGDYFAREVLPHVPDAWIDEAKRDEKDGQVGIVGYEINFNRHFYQFSPPRALRDIDSDLKMAEDEILRLLREVTE